MKTEPKDLVEILDLMGTDEVHDVLGCLNELQAALYALLKEEQSVTDFLIEKHLDTEYEEWREAREPEPEPPSDATVEASKLRLVR